MLEVLANQIANILIKELRRQYLLQGHKLTGRLINSIEGIVRLTASGANIAIIMEDYGIIVNNGVPASRIPYSPNKRTGAKSSKYIEGLKRFAALRFGLSGKEALNAAFAIARKHALRGMPTRGSFKFSKTGKRTGAIEAAILDTGAEITKITEDFLEELILTNLAA